MQIKCSGSSRGASGGEGGGSWGDKWWERQQSERGWVKSLQPLVHSHKQTQTATLFTNKLRSLKIQHNTTDLLKWRLLSSTQYSPPPYTPNPLPSLLLPPVQYLCEYMFQKVTVQRRKVYRGSATLPKLGFSRLIRSMNWMGFAQQVGGMEQAIEREGCTRVGRDIFLEIPRQFRGITHPTPNVVITRGL